MCQEKDERDETKAVVLSNMRQRLGLLYVHNLVNLAVHSVSNIGGHR